MPTSLFPISAQVDPCRVVFVLVCSLPRAPAAAASDLSEHENSMSAFDWLSCFAPSLQNCPFGLGEGPAGCLEEISTGVDWTEKSCERASDFSHSGSLLQHDSITANLHFRQPHQGTDTLWGASADLPDASLTGFMQVLIFLVLDTPMALRSARHG